MNLKGLKANEWHDTNEPGLRILYQEVDGAYDVSLWNTGKQPKTIFIEGSFKSILPEQLYAITGLKELDGLDCQIYYDDKWFAIEVKPRTRTEQITPNIPHEEQDSKKEPAGELDKPAKIQSNGQQLTSPQISKKQLHELKAQTGKQEYHEGIESERNSSQRLAEAIEQNLEKGLGYLKEIEQARDDIFEIKADIREEIISKLQKTIIQAEEKQQQLKDRLAHLDEFEYRDLDRKRQEIVRQVQQAGAEIQQHYIAEMLSDASLSSIREQTEILSAILVQVTAFKNALVKANYSKEATLKTVTAVEYLLEETLQVLQQPLPKLNLPEVSNPREYEQQQAQNLAQLVLTAQPPEKMPPGAFYIDYVWQEYWHALLEYKKRLSEVKPEEYLFEAEGKVEGVLKDIVGNLMDAFDEHKAADNSQAKVSAYFNNQYLPRILDLAAFEEITIEIGKTRADQRLHEITGTKRGNYESGVIVEVIQRGFRRKDDKTPLRKPIVIRGEPD